MTDEINQAFTESKVATKAARKALRAQQWADFPHKDLVYMFLFLGGASFMVMAGFIMLIVLDPGTATSVKAPWAFVLTGFWFMIAAGLTAWCKYLIDERR